MDIEKKSPITTENSMSFRFPWIIKRNLLPYLGRKEALLKLHALSLFGISCENNRLITILKTKEKEIRIQYILTL